MVMLSWGYDGKEVDLSSVFSKHGEGQSPTGQPFIAFTSNTQKNMFIFYYDGPLTGVKPKDASRSL